jgi:hypothetical protein
MYNKKPDRNTPTRSKTPTACAMDRYSSLFEKVPILPKRMRFIINLALVRLCSNATGSGFLAIRSKHLLQNLAKKNDQEFRTQCIAAYVATEFDRKNYRTKIKNNLP